MAQQFPQPEDSGSLPPQQPFNYQPAQPPAPPPSNNRRTLIIVLVVLLVLCICIVAFGALVYFVIGDLIINAIREASYLGFSAI